MEFDDLIFAVNAGSVGNCSACGFRNWPKLCKQMTCQSADYSFCVYWNAKVPGMDTGRILNRISDFYDQSPDVIRNKCLEKIGLVR